MYVYLHKINNNMKKTIYALVCPIDKVVKYVGVTKKDLSDRFFQHLQSKDNGLKANWIKKLKEKGERPRIIELMKVESKQAGEMEKIFIQHYENKGLYLFNINNG